tara:strand:- start:300 stop:500 length:201 start_codon:yes stop_codon:yes gene_type:complete
MVIVMNDKAEKRSRKRDRAKQAGQAEAQGKFRGEFRVSAARLKEIGNEGFRRMENLADEDIGEFAE